MLGNKRILLLKTVEIRNLKRLSRMLCSLFATHGPGGQNKKNIYI